MKLLKKLKLLFKKEQFPELNLLEKRINYKFINKEFLEKAITHRSIQNQPVGNYERLEFIGDAVIDQTVSLWLYKKFPNANEGNLTKKRSSLVNRNFLSKMGSNLNVIDFIKVDSSVNINDPKVADKILSDVYESIVGAIYLDSGYKSAAHFVHKTLCNSKFINYKDQNYKGQLIEYCHNNELLSPTFKLVESYGPEHSKIFVVKVVITDDKSWDGKGSTKKSAEQNAARNALVFLLG